MKPIDDYRVAGCPVAVDLVKAAVER